ncbi:MAG TPA: methyltransferase domain-containing protein [Thermoanaerobaculia bacterium]|jgi:predicted SAM-dependent methyltransferase|nr:methyltransferase domain-containing protein [Thermoanaerobaculia bacterium]
MRLWTLDRTLRQLQSRYYRGDTSAIPEYLTTLAQARALVNAPRARAVHLGAGGHHLDGWINVDLLPDGADLLADCGAHALPFRSESVDFIHSEDLLEHLDRVAGKALLHECHRVLKSGGVMRLLTPDLRALIQRVYIERDRAQLAWCNETLSASGPCEALNMHLRMNGEHRFVYDEEHLTEVLRATGFRVRRASWNRSRVPQLRYLDLRDFGLNLFLEAVK